MIEVQYPRGEDMEPQIQGPLLAAIEAAAARGPVAILFRVSDELPRVKLEVPTLWLGVVGRAASCACSRWRSSPAPRA